MKRLGTIAVIAGLLLAAALFYRLQADREASADSAASTGVAVAPAPSSADPPSPTTSATAPGLLTLQADSSHGFVPSMSAQEIYAAIDVTAQKVEGGVRPPLNIALAMDRSGSMGGIKMQYAKEAAIALVDKLRPQDRLSLVSYATNVTVMMESRLATESAKGAMRRAIQNLRPAGGTNISGGYTYAFGQVQKYMSANSVNRVILVSDGEATVGTTSPHALRNMARTYRLQGVSLTTIGVGLDYNEDVMSGMADEGAGNYYFVDNPGTAVSIFEREMESLAKTVAKNTAVLISLGEGVNLKELYGFNHQRVGDKVVISLAELRSAENKNILLKLGVDPAKSGKFSLMDVTLSYQDVRDDQEHTVRAELASVRTRNATLAQKEINVEVIERVQQIEVARALEEAMTAYEAGRDEEAQQVLGRTKRNVNKAQRKYGLKSKGVSAAGAELDATLEVVHKPNAPASYRRRAVKQKKMKGRNMKKSDMVEMW